MSIELIVNELKAKFTDKEIQHLAVSLFVNASDKQRMRELLDEYIAKGTEDVWQEKPTILAREKKARAPRKKVAKKVTTKEDE